MKNTVKGKIHPGHGGCWFCHCKDDDLVFEPEWDTFVHVSCILKALKDDPNHPEAQFMTTVFSAKDGGWVDIKDCDFDSDKTGN